MRCHIIPLILHSFCVDCTLPGFVCLARILPCHVSQQLPFDNWFSGIPLLFYLAKVGICALVMVSHNRFLRCTMPMEQHMGERVRFE